MPNSKLSIQRLYVKNLSFTTDETPESFRRTEKPTYSLEMRVSHRALEEKNHYDVILALLVTTKIEEKVVCTINVEQAGVFHIENIEGEQLEQVLGAHCPNILYPYARNVISQLASFGSFADAGLQPIDFLTLYAERQKKEETEPSEQNPASDEG